MWHKYGVRRYEYFSVTIFSYAVPAKIRAWHKDTCAKKSNTTHELNVYVCTCNYESRLKACYD